MFVGTSDVTVQRSVLNSYLLTFTGCSGSARAGAGRTAAGTGDACPRPHTIGGCPPGTEKL